MRDETETSKEVTMLLPSLARELECHETISNDQLRKSSGNPGSNQMR